MAGEIWVREYAESYGAKVDWDDTTKEVIIDGVRIKPSFVSEGKAYIPKETIDAVLVAKGRKSPPGTERAIEEEYQREGIEESLRINLSARGIMDFLNRINPVAIAADAFERAKAWALEHIWKPVTDWWDEATSGFSDILSAVRKIPSGLVTFIGKVGTRIRNVFEVLTSKIYEVGNAVYERVFEYVSGTVEYVMGIKARLTVLFEEWWDKLRWYVSEVFEDIAVFFSDPVASVATLLMKGFSLWWEKVADMIEDYIDAHWEDEI